MGEALIAGIVVIALGSLFVIINSIDKPVENSHSSVEEWIDAPSDIISLRHVGGEPINVEDLKVNVQINGKNYVYPSSEISESLGKNTFELADVIQINTSKEWGIGIAEEKNMDVKLVDTSSKEVVPKYRISFIPESTDSSEETVDFDIIDDTVVPQDNFICSFEVLGAAHQYQYHGHTYNRMVTSRLKVGDETFDPWGDYTLPVSSNLNDGSTHSWTLDATYSAGTPVTVIGRAWILRYDNWWSSTYYYNLDSSWKNTMEVSSTSNSPNLIVLRNGDAVPDIAGAMNQDSIEDYLEGYIDENNKVVLEENEAIFLFELGTTDLRSSAADFQDLVVLMTVEPAPAS